MSKLKTHKGASKRFKKTASGFKRAQSHRRHILTKKSTKRKRHLRHSMMISKSDVANVKQMLPNV